jgi:8-oxo-dGTP diphosphatase
MPRAQCLVHRDNKVLMVKHHQGEQEWWCLPGGGVEPGEEPVAAALRELEEECCLVGKAVRQMSHVCYAPGDETYTFLVDVGEQEPVLGYDPDMPLGDQVLAEVRWLSLDEIPERDRAFLWAAGLLGVGEFFGQVEAWGNEISLPGKEEPDDRST